ncbi:hypothetical protein D6851_04775 [Altericroceibacterium spongiae]|uniref:Uncharacterized protein n=2 Tax=Altericroceibacterium spongiae TaxID=2320269 RepID=A0A420EQ15_9SPHN|nr:hypothetical protein D6851_04775 [Altericroceibacterium spongiae]
MTLSSTLAACQKSDSDPGPGGVTVGEAKALDEAAEMLEKPQLPEEALEPGQEPAPDEQQARPQEVSEGPEGA